MERCPTCGGRLHIEEEHSTGEHDPGREWACMLCGWRQTITLAQLAARGLMLPTQKRRVPRLPGA